MGVLDESIWPMVSNFSVTNSGTVGVSIVFGNGVGGGGSCEPKGTLGDVLAHHLAQIRMPEMALDCLLQMIHAFGMDAMFMVPLDELGEHGVWENNKTLVRKR